MHGKFQLNRSIRSPSSFLRWGGGLREDVNNLLSIDHFDDSMDKNEKFHRTIERVQKAIEQENRSKSMTCKLFY
jgi:hypothetical protein